MHSRPTGELAHCGGCGHAYNCHGDRSVAACVPETIRGYGSLPQGNMGQLIPFHHKCYCTGWRRIAFLPVAA